MEVRFPMSEVAQNPAVMSEIAELAACAHGEITRSNVATQPDYENRCFPIESFIDSTAPVVLCSAALLRNGLVNPDVPYAYYISEWDDTVLQREPYRNPNQSASICRDYLTIEGERHALWGDELQGLMRALKESGIEPVGYETSDNRLKWHETLSSYLEKLEWEEVLMREKNAGIALIPEPESEVTLYGLEAKVGSQRPSSRKPRWAA